jgi:hypothetical protein
MKCNISHTQLVIMFVFGLVVSVTTSVKADDHTCSLAHSAAKWSFTDNGTVVGIGPRTAVGVLTLDGHGNVVNGAATSSLNGSVAVETFSGTYTVNSDCSGSIDVKIYSGGTELFEITGATAYDDDMKQMRGVFTSVTAPNGAVLPTVINLEARKQ